MVNGVNHLRMRLEVAALGLGVTLLGLHWQTDTAIAAPVNQYNQSSPADIIIDPNPQAQPPSETPVNNPNTVSSGDPRFVCQYYNGQYTVMYRPESQPGQAYPWAIPQSLANGWTPQRRCQEISRRLESYRPDGLVSLDTGYENGYSTICVTTDRVPRCRIVLTVPPGDNATDIRNRVFRSLTMADSGQMTQGVSAFTGDGSAANLLNQLGGLFNWKGTTTARPASTTANTGAINLKPFLDKQDGGTGAQLNHRSQQLHIK